MNHPVALPGTAPSDQPAEKRARRDDARPLGDLRSGFRRWFWRRVLRAFTGAYLLLLELLRLVRRRPRPIAAERALDILLTGTFHSENWVAAHVRPLASSEATRRVRVVTTCALGPLPNVEVGSIIEYRYRKSMPRGWVFDSRWLLSDELFTRRGVFSLRPEGTFLIRWSWPLGLPPGTNPPANERGLIRLETRDSLLRPSNRSRTSCTSPRRACAASP